MFNDKNGLDNLREHHQATLRGRYLLAQLSKLCFGLCMRTDLTQAPSQAGQADPGLAPRAKTNKKTSERFENAQK